MAIARTSAPASHRELRDIIVETLRHDLLGPENPNELLRERPRDHYLLGMLAPAGAALEDEDTEEDLSAEDEEEADDSGTRGSGKGLQQSSLGLTVSIEDIEGAELVARVSYAIYENAPLPGDPSGASGWQRVPVLHEERLRITRGDQLFKLPYRAELHCRARERQGLVFVTLTLINRNPTEPREKRETLFQPRIEVRPGPGTRMVAAPRPRLTLADKDEDTDELLYRDVLEYAVGHGCAVEWQEQEGHAAVVATDLLPSYELPAVEPLPSTMAETSMYALGEIAADSDLAAALRPLVEEYKSWIADRGADVPRLSNTELQNTARRHLGECRDACLRMDEGIALLESNHSVAEAFRFANMAMAEQQRHAREARARREKTTFDASRFTPRWRPFQLGFILLNLASLADPLHEERGLVDLLWFPTGGGKTEAYLGLSAFAIAHRRLLAKERGQPGHGMTVLMRYTLRLLTAQQFERAAILICACEQLRRADPGTWGDEAITIGLWVGAGATPNTFADARDALRDLINGKIKLKSHPFVLRSCPWCGEAISVNSFQPDPITERMIIRCVNRGCDFDTGLPVVVVDDEIYRRPPSMIIGTVDKFARLPWVPNAAGLFGLAPMRCATHGYLSDGTNCHGRRCSISRVALLPPPALIIQDELHLISGPLGSLVGLYEAAIDFLASREERGQRYGPKIVASTATIRRSPDQVLSLFGRDVRLFPPPAIDPFDSYFARVMPISERPGRLYVGLCAFGKSAKTMLVRVYTSLLQAAAQYAHEPDLVDPYWTVLGYFNSLAQLGGAVSLVQDDVNSRLRAQAVAGLGPGRLVVSQEELTSRIKSTEIPERLQEMQRSMNSGQALDVLLASNMISVGLDVDRLGLMVVSAQPKRTAEYIQASSRVGRMFPGLVITAYNWTSPRDLSHFERFGIYHRTLYRHVEATSVTPYAPRCRDKGLHAIAVAAMRLTHPRLAPNDGARQFEQAMGAHTDFVRELVERVRRADPGEEMNLALELQAFLDRWETRAAHGSSNLVYYRRDHPEQSLMAWAGSNPASADVKETLNSLRDVEDEARWQRVAVPRV